MKEPKESAQGSIFTSNDYDDFDHMDSNEDRAFWKKESMPQVSMASRTGRPLWHLCAVLIVSVVVLISLIITVSVNNVNVNRRFTVLEETIHNLSASVTSITSKVHAGKDTDENFHAEINKLKVSMETTQTQLTSVMHSLKAIDALEPLKTLVNQMHCNLEKMTKNITTQGCCPLGWSFYSSSCYFFSTETKSWDSARDQCSSMHSSLVTLKSDDEWTFVATRTKPQFFWIGLTDERTGDWEWVDGTPYVMDRRRWKPGQPDNWRAHGLGGGEDCAHLHNDGRLNDIHCSHQFPFVCKATITES